MPKRREIPYDPMRLTDLEETGHQALDFNQFGGSYDEVVRAVEALPDFYRFIIERLFWERMTLRALGAELGLDKHTVSYHRDKALELLKKELAKCA